LPLAIVGPLVNVECSASDVPARYEMT